MSGQGALVAAGRPLLGVLLLDGWLFLAKATPARFQ